MKIRTILYIIGFLAVSACSQENSQRYIFFLHNRFIEEHSLEEIHPEYGKAEYQEIIHAFEMADFKVITEKRQSNTNARKYALKVKHQVDSLILEGVEPNKITIIGTSKGGYIAQYVSTFTQNPELNYIFIGSYQDSDIQNFPDINFCGNILTIYEKSDFYGVSAIKRKETSNLKVSHFSEIELNTGLKHGFLFKPLKEWIEPSIKWARQNYEMN